MINTVKFNFPCMVFKNPNSLRPICKSYGPRCLNMVRASSCLTRNSVLLLAGNSFLRTKIKTFKNPISKTPNPKIPNLLNIDKYHHADKQRRARNADSETSIC